MKISQLPLTLSSLLASMIFGFSHGQALAASSNINCLALVQSGNNLWLVRPDGTLVNQITRDTWPRYASALSPLGTVIAFTGKAAPDDVTLIDLSGRTLANVSLNLQSPATALTWLNTNMLRVEEHYSPSSSIYHFVDLSSGATSPVVSSTIATGSLCTPSPNGRDMACAIAGAEINLNDRVIYHVADEFLHSTLLQSASMANGSSMTTNTSPVFRVEFQGMSPKGKVILRVTTPDGVWSEQYIAPGGKLVVRFQDAMHDLADYAFQPTVSNPGVIRLDVRKATMGASALDGDMAWDSRGKRLAFVTVNAAGERTLLILNRELGQAADTGRGALDLEEPLPIDGPIRSVAFVSDTHIRVIGQTQQFDQDIAPQGKITSGKSFAVTPALPAILNVNFMTGAETAAVKGWSCK